MNEVADRVGGRKRQQLAEASPLVDADLTRA